MALTDNDALVVKIKADIKSLQSGLRQAAREADIAGASMQKGLGDSARNVEAALAGMAAKAAAATIAVGYAAKRAIEYAGNIKDTAVALNIGSDALQEFRYAAIQNGASVEQMDAALGRLNKTVGDAISVGGESAETFRRLGVELRDSGGNVRSTEAILGDVADAVRSLGSSQEQAAELAKLFGREAGPRMIELLSGGREAIDRYREAAREAGAVIKSDLIDRADEMSDKLAAATVVVKSQLTTALVGLIDKVRDAGEEFAKLQGYRDLPFQKEIEETQQAIKDLIVNPLEPYALLAYEAKLGFLKDKLEELQRKQRGLTQGPAPAAAPGGVFVGPPAPTDADRKAAEHAATAEAAAAARRRERHAAELEEQAKHNQALVEQTRDFVSTEEALQEMRYQARRAGIANMSKAEYEAATGALHIATTQAEMLAAIDKKHLDQQLALQEESIAAYEAARLASIERIEQATTDAGELQIIEETDRLAANLALLATANEQELEALGGYLATKEAMIRESEARIQEIKGKAITQSVQGVQRGLSDEVSFYAHAAQQTLQLLASSGRKNFEEQKKYAIAAAVINTAAGVAGALKDGSYESIARAAVIAAMGLAQIGVISRQQYGQGRSGSPVVPAGSATSGGGGEQRQAPRQNITINVPDGLVNSVELGRFIATALNAAISDGAELNLVNVV